MGARTSLSAERLVSYTVLEHMHLAQRRAPSFVHGTGIYMDVLKAGKRQRHLPCSPACIVIEVLRVSLHAPVLDRDLNFKI